MTDVEADTVASNQNSDVPEIEKEPKGNSETPNSESIYYCSTKERSICKSSEESSTGTRY
ncbi:hypothetical protein A2U01_0069688, partial [Trifolium medium]|nr:hypothetical protein [Trifolium medium]